MKNYYIFLEATDSTNNELKRRLSGGVPPEEFTVVSAGAQTAGRGRSGHDWTSPPGVSISTSMVCYPFSGEQISGGALGAFEVETVETGDLPESLVPGVTILAAIAVERAIEGLVGLPTQIKWPNDILIDGRKVCGILSERVGRAVIIGVGINLRRGSYPASLAWKATSLEEELERSDETIDRNKLRSVALTESVWNHFRGLYETFLGELSLDFLRDEYNDRLINKGRTVRVLDPKGHYEAVALGVDEKGRLVTRMEDTGEMRRVDSGEVQVRGLDGYI